MNGPASMKETARHKLMIYGCYGFLGRLIAEYAVSRPDIKNGLLLAGRNERKLVALAKRLDLPYRVFGLGRPEVIDRNIHDVQVILNVAGPLSNTVEPIIQSCVRTRTHYLDITGEQYVFRLLFENLRSTIDDSGIVCVPGVGFTIVPTDCLSAMLASQMPDATSLELSFAFSNPYRPTAASAGATKATINVVRTQSIHTRRNGLMTPAELFYKTRRVIFPNAGRAFVGWVPWGDCLTAWHTTGIPNIDVYVPVDPVSVSTATVSVAITRFALSIPGLQAVWNRLINMLLEGPSTYSRATARMDVWGEVRNRKGDVVRGSLCTLEAYTFTVLSSVFACERVLRGEVPAGVKTPTQALGKDFVLQIPATKLYEFMRESSAEAAAGERACCGGAECTCGGSVSPASSAMNARGGGGSSPLRGLACVSSSTSAPPVLAEIFGIQRYWWMIWSLMCVWGLFIYI